MILECACLDNILVTLAPSLFFDVTGILCDSHLALLYPRLQLLESFDPVSNLVDFEQLGNDLHCLVLNPDTLNHHVDLLLLLRVL